MVGKKEGKNWTNLKYFGLVDQMEADDSNQG